MKNAILLIVFSICSMVACAQTRTLTDEERSNLSNSEDFKKLCQQSAIRYAVFIEAGEAGMPSGGGTANRAAWIQYVKDVIFATAIIKNGASDDKIATRYLTLGLNKQFNLGAAPQSNTTLIQAWQTANAFEEFNPAYFSLLGNDIDTSIDSN